MTMKETENTPNVGNQNKIESTLKALQESQKDGPRPLLLKKRGGGYTIFVPGNNPQMLEAIEEYLRVQDSNPFVVHTPRRSDFAMERAKILAEGGFVPIRLTDENFTEPKPFIFKAAPPMPDVVVDTKPNWRENRMGFLDGLNKKKRF